MRRWARAVRESIRQLLTESILLAGLGGVLGLALALWGTKAILKALPAALPRANEVSIDPTVLIFTMGLSLFAGIIFGLAPALKAIPASLQQVMNQSGRGSAGFRRDQGTLVVAEVAMALVLLVGAGLMLRTLEALWRVNPGFNPSHAITFGLSSAATPTTSSAETRAHLALLRRENAFDSGRAGSIRHAGIAPHDS